MRCLRSIMTLSILASLSLLAVPATARAQVTSPGNSNHAAGAPSPADAASLQKKATQAQARICANKDDRDQLKRAIKLNEVTRPKKSCSETDSPLKTYKMRRLLCGQAEEREAKTK